MLFKTNAASIVHSYRRTRFENMYRLISFYFGGVSLLQRRMHYSLQPEPGFSASNDVLSQSYVNWVRRRVGKRQ